MCSPSGICSRRHLFLYIYIYDIHKPSNKLQFLCADDTTLLFANKNLQLLEKFI